MKKSVDAGHVVTLDKIDCIIDGLRVKRVGENTFSVVQRFVDDIVTLPDKDIFDAMIWIMSHCKLVVEGAAAAPVAALLHGLIKAPAGSKVACVLSGGNVNLDQRSRPRLRLVLPDQSLLTRPQTQQNAAGAAAVHVLVYPNKINTLRPSAICDSLPEWPINQMNWRSCDRNSGH
jgi:hypothetical protein